MFRLLLQGCSIVDECRDYVWGEMCKRVCVCAYVRTTGASFEPLWDTDICSLFVLMHRLLIETEDETLYLKLETGFTKITDAVVS